jgi:hypothetical protein
MMWLGRMMRLVGVLSAVVIALAAAGSYSGLPSRTFQWPQITPVHKSFYFPDAWRASAALEIKGTDATPLYRLQCYGEKADRNPSDLRLHPDALYSGEFDCHLYALSSHTEWDTLLTDITLPGGEAYSRAVVGATDFVGACSNYPEYGLVRHFRLRGMRITFTYSDVKTKEYLTSNGAPYPPGTPRVELPELTSFRFTVDIVPDPTAVSTIAEPVPFAPPPPKKTANPYVNLPNCEKVIRRHVPGVVSEAYIRHHDLQRPFPVIRPTEAEATFVGQKPGMLRLNVLGEDGKSAYEVACAAGPEEAGLDQWGIRCSLHRIGEKLDLLSDAVDPYSQENPALIRPEQLYGSCADYPGWGVRRVFSLRGFRLTLSLPVQPTFLPSSVQLHVEITPDPTATSPVARSPQYIYWGVSTNASNTCETLLTRPEFHHLFRRDLPSRSSFHVLEALVISGRCQLPHISVGRLSGPSDTARGAVGARLRARMCLGSRETG